MTQAKLKKFDAAEYLNTQARRAAYLAAALETGDPDFARDALSVLARAYGMNKVATGAGLHRVSLYKALGASGNPEFGTVLGIIKALGLTMSVRPAAKQARKRPRAASAKAAARAAHATARVEA